MSIANFVKNAIALGVARYARDAGGNASGIMNPNGGKVQIGTHVSAVILGDSISRRATSAGVNTTAPALGVWNWANWLIGSPFVYVSNLGVSGDKTQSIMSRISAIPSNIQIVMIMAGTNDVANLSSSANQAAIDAAYSTLSGYIQSGVNALVSSGKRVVISTVPPMSAYSVNTDSRIQFLDRINTFISSLAVPNSVFVIDGFTAIWDSTQPSIRVAKANTLSDGVHPNNLGCRYFGDAAISAMQQAYRSCMPDYNLYQDFQLAIPLFSAFRTNTGGTVGTKTNGTGTLADGWRSINNPGTAVFTLDNAEAYSLSNNYVGAAACVANGIDEHWQVVNISSASAGDGVEIRTNQSITNLTGFPDNIVGGSQFFMELDVEVGSPINLIGASCSITAFFTSGTSPADQPYQGTTYNAVSAGSPDDFSVTPAAHLTGFRYLLRTPLLRVPENINNASGLTLLIKMGVSFNGSGSAIVKFGRPRIWNKQAGLI